MDRRARLAFSIALIAGGLALAVFYYLLFAIADCSAACVVAGERAVPLGLIGVGLGLATAGATLFRMEPRRALGWGLSSAGVTTVVGCAVLIFGEGSAGLAYWIGAVGLVEAGAGVVVRRP